MECIHGKDEQEHCKNCNCDSKEKKEFKIPVEWAMYGVVTIEAETLDEAIKFVEDDVEGIPLPQGDYIDGSWQVNGDKNFIQVLNKEKLK